jgi:hypothetical protein
MWIASLRAGIALSLLVALLPAPLNLRAKEVGFDARRPAGVAEHQSGFRSESDAALAEWALTRFDRAGLMLPPLVISFHDERADCGGNFGLFRSGAPARVDICGFNWDRFVVTARKTVLHELAHAWLGHTLTEAARGRFLDLRGLQTWGDDEFPWEEQGSEQAAEIIAWALIDEDLELTRFKDANPAALSEAYLQLTGSRPPLRVQGMVPQHRDVSW